MTRSPRQSDPEPALIAELARVHTPVNLEGQNVPDGYRYNSFGELAACTAN